MYRFFLTVAVAMTMEIQAADSARTLRFQADKPAEARVWQKVVRQKLFNLMMGGAEPSRCPLAPELIRRVEVPGATYALEELTLQTLPDRRAHVWSARPRNPKGKVGAVLALHGHGGTGEEIVRGLSLYWYGREMAQRGYVVVAPDIGQHELQHTNWSLMGERTWDALRCVDYLLTLPEVDPKRIAVAGLSLGGETTMYVAALDERLRAACSSGWLTTVANMKNGHCPCYDFPGLEAHFDFADIFSCIAPRRLVCELGELEKAPGGFPVSIGREAMQEVRVAYGMFGAEDQATLTVHSAGHVFSGRDFFPILAQILGEPVLMPPQTNATLAWVRFVDAPETLDGQAYHWLGRTNLHITMEVPPAAGHALELSWGAKSDQRQAILVVNGHSVSVQEGGHWGFRWIRVPVPEGIQGKRYEIDLRKGQGNGAFLSEVRLVSSAPKQGVLNLAPASHRGSVFGSAINAVGAATEAFPAMRALWDTEPVHLRSAGTKGSEEELFRQAEQNGRAAAEGFFRCRRYVDGWLAHADPLTGLIPRNLTESRDYWNGRDSGADNYPFMVLTASMTDRPLLEGRLLEILRTETRLTCRHDRLPDDYSFSKRGWRREKFDLDATIFDGAEYVKDGLLPLAEWLGPSPWSERMIGLIDDIWKNASIETPFGKLPTLNFEVNGDLLQACSRLYWFTGDRKYLEWAVRLGDYYLLGDHHPTWHGKELRLVDHGCEVINGLSELYVAVSQSMPEKRSAYQKPLYAIFDTVLELGRNQHGLLYTTIQPQARTHAAGLCDTWGYNYDGFYTLYLVDGKTEYRDAVVKTLSNLKGNYVGAVWEEKSADAYADSIEGAINLYRREPVASAADWIESQIRMMWAIQKSDGIIEGWHGDGNFARTTLMYCLWKTQGLRVEPWRPDVRVGAVRDESGLLISLKADRPWKGRLVFDKPRHRLHMRLPFDYPRINQFPEWFTVESDHPYAISESRKTGRSWKAGRELQAGIPLALRPELERRLRVVAAGR